MDKIFTFVYRESVLTAGIGKVFYDKNIEICDPGGIECK
jgi:hypothetical protein